MWKLLARCAPGALPSVVMWIIARVSAAALAVAFVLVGCVPTTTPASPAPQPSATPVFATEAEALAAATEAYAAYQTTLDDAFSSYENASLSKVASGAALSKAKNSVANYQKVRKRQTGRSSIDTVSFVDTPSVLLGDNKSLVAQTYLCLDLSQVDVLDGDDRSVVPAGSERRFPIVASLVWDRSLKKLLVDKDESWSGENFC